MDLGVFRGVFLECAKLEIYVRNNRHLQMKMDLNTNARNVRIPTFSIDILGKAKEESYAALS